MGFDALPIVVRTAKNHPAPTRAAVSPPFRSAAMIGNFPPRRCGIATFTRDAYASLRGALPGCHWSLVAMEDAPGARAYPASVTHTIPQQDVEAYLRVADDLNRSGAEVCFIQHEFGIFGGDAGEHVLALMRRLKMPVVATLHTVLENPSPQQKRVLDEIIRLASAVIVMSELGADILARVHRAGPGKVHVIPHGAPERPFASPETFKAPLGLAGRKVMMTFGLLSPNKGLETVIRALPEILSRHPDALYLIVGATHPHLVARDGEGYRQSLIDLATSLGVDQHIRFVNRYVNDDELVDFLQAADIYVTPYLTEAQITSGTLAYAVALGKPVVSTPYWHAREALAGGVGVLCPFSDSKAFARELTALFSDQVRREAMARRAYKAGESSRWRKVADATVRLAEASRVAHDIRTDDDFRALARPRLTALLRMSDDCGVMQHSRFGAPDRRHGYCSDDNARALNLLARLAEEGEPGEAATRLMYACAAFISHAWNPETGRFRNFMGFDRRWLDEGGSDDCCARAFEALCLTARHAATADLRDWAADLAREALPHVHTWASLRAKALIIRAALAGEGRAIAADEAVRLIAASAQTLVASVDKARAAGHDWFEPAMAYDNARLPEALILAGRRLGDEGVTQLGLDMFDRLQDCQTAPQGCFCPVPTSTFDRDGAEHRQFDQQPIEALATVEACITAWRVSGDRKYADAAREAFLWFGGENVHGLPLARPGDGACHDGLTVTGVNRNTGAESILSYLLAALSVRDFLRLRASPP